MMMMMMAMHCDSCSLSLPVHLPLMQLSLSVVRAEGSGTFVLMQACWHRCSMWSTISAWKTSEDHHTSCMGNTRLTRPLHCIGGL
jgi:hypothetical protein